MGACILNTKLNESEPENPKVKERRFALPGDPFRCLARHKGNGVIRRHGVRTGSGHLLALA